MAGAVARLALAYRARQALVSARLARQITQAWRDLSQPARIDTNWPTIRSLMVASVLTARRESASLAEHAYMEARRDAGIDEDGFRPPRPPALEGRRLTASLDVTGPVEFKRAVAAGKSPQQAVDAAAVRLAGSTTYLALDGGRQVMQQAIVRDERASGYARVTDNDPCAWCAMLASRGPVYKSAATAGDPRRGGTTYHDACACQAWPAFTLNEDFVGIADRLYDDWLRETRGTGGRDAVNAFRRWWEAEGRARYEAPQRP